ncbi:MAG: single-stranded-DNA-specific exonuclease RecJ [Ruminococcus sp.]|nr:single-stranded-DNA-specific exonuclease RecJ [Ruminococcus sp.]
MKQWSVEKLNKDNAKYLGEQYGLSPIVSALLDIRGITSEHDVQNFLYENSSIDNPFELKDMDRAVERILTAVENGEKICVYGDFDADGVTATALLYSYLETLGSNVMYYIPDRESEGYGIHKSAIDVLNSEEVELIISVDTGISAVEEIEYAQKLGIDTVVTDHHVLGDSSLPDACAVVNPHRADCGSRFKQISGVGVAFKLVCAIEGEYADIDMLLDNYSDLVCIGTIGDIVPLVDENRVFVKRGLDIINNADRPGIRALIEVSGLKDKEVTSGSVSFTLVPRINAVGRLGLSKDSVALLLTEDYEEALEIAQKLSDDNSQRQKIEKDILYQINKTVGKNPSLVQDRVIVIDGEGWKKGVVGIVSSRIKEIYGKPCIIISRDGNEANGSGRSVEGFDLWSAVNSCSDILTHFGGHTMACGLGLESENIDVFRRRVNEYAANLDSMPYNKLKIDCKLNPQYVDLDVARDLSALAPFGAGNQTPVFQLSNLSISSITPIKNDSHLRISFFVKGKYINAIKFKCSSGEFPYKIGDVVDVAVTLDTNEYNGSQNLSIIIKDIKFSDLDYTEYINSNRIFESFCRGEFVSDNDLNTIIPNRGDFAIVYRALKSLANSDNISLDVFTHNLKGNVTYGKVRVILEAMNDLGLIAFYEDTKKCSLKLLNVNTKVNLDDAEIIKSLKEVYRNE